MHAHRHAALFIALASATALTAEALAAAPRFKMKLNAGQAEQGVSTISLVEKPAIQRGWIALSAVEPAAAKRFHLSEVGAKQVLTGPALIPGLPILRLNEDGTPYYIEFDEEAIEATQKQFAAQLRHTSTNQDHAIPLDGNTVIENWIIRDPACDTALALGLSDLPKGTWMLSVHIPNAEYWQNEIVSGNKTGFSIEGLFSPEQLTLSAVKPTALSTVSTVKNWFKNWTAKLSAEKAKELAVTLGVVQLADGRAVNIDDATGAVTVANADGTPGEPLEDGTHALADGGELVVTGGLQVKTPAPDPTPAAGDPAPNPAADPAPAADGDPAAKGTTDERLDKVESQVAEILAIVKQNADPAKAPAGEKLATALHKIALADLGPKLAALKLDAIELVEGGKLIYNAVTRQLRKEDGSLAEGGYYAAADGSYFNVTTDQYIYEISKPTYDSVYLKEVALADANAKLAKTPAGERLNLHKQEGAEEKPKTRLQLAREVAKA